MVIHVTDSTHAGEARQQAAQQVGALGLTEQDRGALAIVVTELATNLAKHAGSGTLLLDSFTHNGACSVRLLSLDKGPGIRDLATALRDGYSSAGTAGTGLGAIKRLSHLFDIYSVPGTGTAVMAEFRYDRSRQPHRSKIEASIVSVPMKGEEETGDGWGVKANNNVASFTVVDGLGHGIFASEAAREAERVFSESKSNSLTGILQESHNALKKTRGAAMSIASIDLARSLVSFAGVGNISSQLVTPTTNRGMASHNGTLGHHLGRIQEFNFPWSNDALLVMHSDGLKSGWDLKAFPGLWAKHPALIAGVLYRDYCRDRDDVTVLVARETAKSGSHES